MVLQAAGLVCCITELPRGADVHPQRKHRHEHPNRARQAPGQRLIGGLRARARAEDLGREGPRHPVEFGRREVVAKSAVDIGYAMTEKQGGSDLRETQTAAVWPMPGLAPPSPALICMSDMSGGPTARASEVQASTRIEVPQRLRVLVTLAKLLERLEHSAVPVSAEQYRSVAEHLVRELAAVEHDETFEKLLAVFPAMSQLYENAYYAHAGLCRSPLDASLAAELEAKKALIRAAKGRPQ